MIPVLYDGWSLVYAPESPPALHLHLLLARPPEGIVPWLALPGNPAEPLPPSAQPIFRPTPDTPRGRLDWEQHLVPALRKRSGARLIHWVTPTASLLEVAPCLISPAGYGVGQAGRRPEGPASFSRRLRAALSAGGLARASGVLWPAGLPHPLEPLRSTRLLRLPPLANPNAPISTSGLPEALPEAYILYPGPGDPDTLLRVVNAWTWAAPAIGETAPLVVAGLDEVSGSRLQEMLAKKGLQESVRVLPPLGAGALLGLVHRCTALFHPGPFSPWGDPVVQALAYGRPVVAAEDPWTAALVGSAAYLAPPEDARALGAALITIAVEESVSEVLSQKALERAAGWRGDEFVEKLRVVYEKAGKR